MVVGVGGRASTHGGLAAVEALGWSLGRADVTVACDVTTTFTDAARVFGPQKGDDRRAGVVTDGDGQLTPRRPVRVPHRRRRSRVAGRRRGGRAAGGLAAIGARLEPGFDVVAGTAGLEDAFDGVSRS